MRIHPSSIIDAKARIADDVRIAAYVVIEGDVTIGPGCVIESHSVLRGPTEVGANCRIGPAAYVGLDPQHLGYKGDESWLIVGEGCIIRETAILHRAFRPGRENATTIGKRCFIMGAGHVGHDARIGDDVVIAHAAIVGGHSVIGDRVFLGGSSGIHQFCRVGRLAIIGGIESITRDVPPFGAMRYDGLKAYNAVGCRRAGLSRESIRAIRAAYQCLHTHRTMTAAVEAIRALGSDAPEVEEILTFIAGSKRGIMPSVHFLDRSESGDEG